MAVPAFRALLKATAPRTTLGRELVADSFRVATLAARTPQVARTYASAEVSTRLSVARLWTRSGNTFEAVKRTSMPFAAVPVAQRTGATVQSAMKTVANQIRQKSSTPEASGGFMASVKNIMVTYPIMFAVGTTLARTAPCDLFAQWGVEGKTWETTDWRRFWGFMFFGGVYVGWLQYYIYAFAINEANIALMGITSRGGVAVTSALLDQLVHSPFVYFPAFCLSIKLIEGSENVLSDTWAKWKDEVVHVCTSSFMLWFPAQMVNFYFMPQYLKIPYINLVGAVWVVWLSLQEGKGKDEVAAE